MLISVTDINLLPSTVGIYQFLNERGEILYIGKAVNLRSRVSSYFKDKHYDRPHIIPLISQIRKILAIETENEIESLVLESALIKKHQPKYNVELKDDKSHAWIYISTREEIPKVQVVRSTDLKQYNKGRLFGPYPSSRATRRVFKYIRKMYPFCTCNNPNPNQSCLNIDLGLCPGPHHGLISREKYMENINEIIKFLKGNKKRHIGSLESQMHNLAGQQKYEEAALLRDKIYDLQHLGTNIHVTLKSDEKSYIKKRSKDLSSVLEYISKTADIKYPVRIECYDISNIQGAWAYGSMTVAINGRVEPNQYRIFKIKGKDTPDDFAMLAEVLKRRLKYVNRLEGDKSLISKPDLILIDGGKGQLSAVREIVPETIDLMGISKGRSLRKKGQRKKDQFWVVRGSITLMVELKNVPILVQLRDEAHRFAITHHRRARGKASIKSVLDDVKGIGPVKKKALKETFGTVNSMKKLSIEELNKVIKNKKVSETLCKRLKSLSN